MSRRLAAPLIALVLASGLAVAEDAAPRLTRDGPPVEAKRELKPGDRIAPFSLPLLGGGQITWPDDLQGQVLVVNFWATWCEPCVEEVPALERLRRQLKGSPITVLSVNIDDAGDMAQVRGLLERSGAQFLTALDPGGQAALQWGTTKLPETYIVTPDGLVQEKIIGAQVWDRGDRVAAYRAMAARTP